MPSKALATEGYMAVNWSKNLFYTYILRNIFHSKQRYIGSTTDLKARLALLAPPIVDAIFAGKAPWTLSLTKLDTTLPYSWKEQMELFGML